MTLTLMLGTAILGVLLSIYLLFEWNKRQNVQAFARRNVRYIPWNNEFISLLKKERTELTKDEIMKREGLKTFGFNMLNTCTILVCDPSIAGVVLSKEFTTFTNRRNIKFTDDLFGLAMSKALDDHWKRLRSIVTPTFTAASLRRMKSRIDETVHNLLGNFEKTIQSQGSAFDVKRLYEVFTMDTTIQVSFGAKVDSLAQPNNPILLNAKQIFSTDMSLKAFVVNMMLFRFPKMAKLFGVNFAKDSIDFFKKFSMQIVEQKKAELLVQGNLGKASSFLELVLEAEAEQQSLAENERKNGADQKAAKFMTTKEMVAQCVLFFLAGYDTTATANSLAAYLLALYPEVQEKLYHEIECVIEKLRQECGDSSGDPVELITIEALTRFEYLTAVVNETLRLYPPATMTERTASKDIVLESDDGSIRLTLQKGDVVHLPIYSMQRDPEQFPEPEQFKPERFVGEPTHHKYSFLPFGAGPRNCVAKSLAELEVKLALLHSVRVFKFSRCEQTKVPFENFHQDNSISPREIVLKVEKRI